MFYVNKNDFNNNCLLGAHSCARGIQRAGRAPEEGGAAAVARIGPSQAQLQGAVGTRHTGHQAEEAARPRQRQG